MAVQLTLPSSWTLFLILSPAKKETWDLKQKEERIKLLWFCLIFDIQVVPVTHEREIDVTEP